MPTCISTAPIIDGVFSAQGKGAQFHEALALGQEDIAAVQREVRVRVLRLFARRGLITPEVAAEMRQWEHGGGFSLDAAVRIEATGPEGAGAPATVLCPPDLCEREASLRSRPSAGDREGRCMPRRGCSV